MNLHHLRNEERQANTDGSDESTAVLLARQHEDGDDQLGREEELDEEALGDAGAAAQRGGDPQGARGEAVDDGGGRDAGEELGGHDEREADPVGGAGEHHGDGDGRVQHGAADAEEDPRVDGEAEPEAQADVEEPRRRVAVGERVRHVGPAEREQQEQEGPHELARRGHEVCWGVWHMSINYHFFPLKVVVCWNR